MAAGDEGPTGVTFLTTPALEPRHRRRRAPRTAGCARWAASIRAPAW